MKTFIKFLLLVTLFLFSLFPTMAATVYLFAGKLAFLEFVTQISTERFWLFGIPFFIIAMAASVFSLMEMISLSSPNKLNPKKLLTPRTPVPFYVEDTRHYPDLCVEDPNLGSKLATKYFQ